MKKYLYTPLFFIFGIVSLFLFSEKAYADTINLTINNTVLNYNNEAYQTLKQHTLDYINNNSDANYYIIYYESSERQVNGKYTNVIDTTKINARIISSLPSISFMYYAEDTSICSRINFNFTPNRGITGFQINASTLTIITTNNLLNFNQYYCSDNILNYVIIDTNITSNLNYQNTNNVFNLDNKGILAVGSPIPTLLEMYPPAPPNPTPLLTNYYALIIQKIGVLATFFADNPYMYAIPLIPIFILCIYLIKRSLIK